MDLVALAPEGFESVLAEEVGERVLERFERLFVLRGSAVPLWAQNVWLEPKRFRFSSISEAARHLRSIQRNWVLHSVAAHRRAQLIQEQLPPMRRKPFEFGSPLPSSPLGSWCLVAPDEMIYSAYCSSPFPDGVVAFAENKVDPPSRAYLKLWEFFTLSGARPCPGDLVLDLGSSPGGWTWVLDQLGCDVISVDKAPLSGKYSSRVQYLSESAFALEPRRVDWLFSDIICYPERLLSLVRRWTGFAENFVCTVKLQGPTDHVSVAEFASIPGSRLRHLYCNKHELTWSSGPRTSSSP